LSWPRSRERKGESKRGKLAELLKKGKLATVKEKPASLAVKKEKPEREKSSKGKERRCPLLSEKEKGGFFRQKDN